MRAALQYCRARAHVLREVDSAALSREEHLSRRLPPTRTGPTSSRSSSSPSTRLHLLDTSPSNPPAASSSSTSRQRTSSDGNPTRPSPHQRRSTAWSPSIRPYSSVSPSSVAGVPVGRSADSWCPRLAPQSRPDRPSRRKPAETRIVDLAARRLNLSPLVPWAQQGPVQLVQQPLSTRSSTRVERSSSSRTATASSSTPHSPSPTRCSSWPRASLLLA